MKEAQLLGKLLPTHLVILPIMEEIREKYSIKDSVGIKKLGVCELTPKK